jgi:4-amino-4-deoxy-L-arabinose transferase-like glycosyltransferase
MDVAAPEREPLLEPDAVGPARHAWRIALLMAAAALFLSWTLRHSEAQLRDGLRSIQLAQQIDQGAWRDGLVGGMDHPLHPLGIVAMHRLIGGEGPEWWERSAVALGYAAVVLLVIPVYLAGRDLFGDRAAWLGCVLFIVNPVVGSIVVNVLSESTFLLFWTWGLWASVRFLRDGRFVWLPLALGFGVLAYLGRPEGLLLPASVVATLVLLPLHPVTRINWPRWWRAIAFLAVGSLVLAGPYMAAKGKIATRPGLARVLGLEAHSPPVALEREVPLPAGQSPFETYRLASLQMFEAVNANVPLTVLALAVVGLAAARSGGVPARTCLFLGLVLATSTAALVRLHATAGYCSPRNALVPGMILTLIAAHGLAWVMNRTSLDGRLLGLPGERLRPGPAVWAVAVALGILFPRFSEPPVSTPGPFNVYWDAGLWLANTATDDAQVLDLTDWSLFFSRRKGASFAQIHEAAADPNIRWVVALKSQTEGASTYAPALRELIGDQPPVVVVPASPQPGQVQVQIFDRLAGAQIARGDAASASTLR